MKLKTKLLTGIFLSLFMVLAGCSNPTTNGEQETNTGQVVFTITDAAADMGQVSEVNIRVESVELHSSQSGWVSAQTQPKTYDLLELKERQEHQLLANANVSEGTYNQMRIQISEVTVVDNEGEHTAKLPSNRMQFNGDVEVNNDSVSTVSFDFIADESLHVTGNGTYILAPVVQFESRSNASTQINSNGRVEISGGQVETNERVGMDINGNVGVGVRIPSNANISINTQNTISIGSGSGNSNIGIGSEGSIGS